MALKYEQLVKAQVLADGTTRSIYNALHASEDVYCFESPDSHGVIQAIASNIPGTVLGDVFDVQRLHVYCERDAEQLYARQNVELREELVTECLDRLFEKFTFFSKIVEDEYNSDVAIVAWDAVASEWMADDTWIWTLKLKMNACFIPYVRKDDV